MLFDKCSNLCSVIIPSVDQSSTPFLLNSLWRSWGVVIGSFPVLLSLLVNIVQHFLMISCTDTGYWCLQRGLLFRSPFLFHCLPCKHHPVSFHGWSKISSHIWSRPSSQPCYLTSIILHGVVMDLFWPKLFDGNDRSVPKYLSCWWSTRLSLL